MPASSFEALSTADVEMGGERPATDPLAMERARARAELALFGSAEPARTGRYEILRPIAGGGMGFVYAAYDPELDRQVALKILHPDRNHDDDASDRLIKEARALARLDHPNVVAVYDVLTHDGEIVIVMELVEGETLERWQVAAPRRWRDVVGAYLQAGAGLAAAHRLDIIHRDFKPSNASIGADGRVRVLDFGLARFTGDARRVARPAGTRAAMTLATATGAVMGTLGYAAPEQLAGLPATAASDQFSFCVALHRAIEGVAPFRGTTVDEVLASIHRDDPALARDGRRVSAWLRAAVRRGLAADPARRHPSMPALLAELGRPRGWKRWRRPAAAALLVAASAIAAVELRDSAALLGCDGDRDAAAVWNPLRRAALTAGLARPGTPYAPEARARVIADLDDRTRQWAAVHRAACVDHRRGAMSDAVFDRAELCLRQRLDDIAAAVGVLDHLGEDVTRAVDVSAGIPPAGTCADPTRLVTEPVPLATPALRAQVTEVHARLSDGAALSRVGREDDAIAALEEAGAEAERTHDAPLIAEAKLAYGRALIVLKRNERAAAVLRDAMKLALAGSQTRLAVEAAARRIFAEGVHAPDLERLGRDLEFVEAMSQSLTGDHLVRPLLLNNIGVVYMAAERPDQALRYFERAHDAIAGDASADLELTIVDQSLAMLSPDPATRSRLSRERWSRLAAALGDHHIDTLQAQMGYALFGADPETAYPLIARTCDAYRVMHPSFVDLYLECEHVRGVVAGELDQPEAAQAAYTAVIDATAGSPDPDHVVARQLAEGALALLRGRPAQAHAGLVAVVAARGASAHWWIRADALEAEFDLGIAAAGAGDRVAAVRHLEAAARGFGEIAAFHHGILYRLQLARARRALASP